MSDLPPNGMDLATARKELLKAIGPAAKASRKTRFAEQYQAEWQREVQARQEAEARAEKRKAAEQRKQAEAKRIAKRERDRRYRERKRQEREQVDERQHWDTIARVFLETMGRAA